MASRSRLTRVERRRKILSAAREVFGTRGYAATRMDDIASAAGVGKGTLYQYFKGKADLFMTLVMVVSRDSLETLSGRSVSPDPLEAMRTAIAFAVELALAENLDLYQLFFDFWGVSATHRGTAQEGLRETESTFRAHILGLLRRGQGSGVFRADLDREQYIHALAAAIDGLSLRIVILGQKVDLKAYTHCLQDLFVRGIMTDQALAGASMMREKRE